MIRAIALAAMLAALAAGYPWLRSPALDAALAVLGSPAMSDGRAAFFTAAAVLAVAVLLWVAASRVSTLAAVGLLALAVAVAVLAAMPAPMRNAAPADGIALRSGVGEWSTAFRGGSVSRVRVLSSLADAAALPAGTAVATLSLERDGRPLAAWTLRAGKDTAEWAADRPDLRGVAAAGPIWWSSLPPPGSFFAHAYASTWQLRLVGEVAGPIVVVAAPGQSLPVLPAGIRVVRDPGLAPTVTLSLLRVEVSE